MSIDSLDDEEIEISHISHLRKSADQNLLNTESASQEMKVVLICCANDKEKIELEEFLINEFIKPKDKENIFLYQKLTSFLSIFREKEKRRNRKDLC